MVGLLGIAILLALMFFVELPVGLAMGLVGLGGLWYLLGPEAAMSVVGTELWGTFSSYGLSVIPLFVWMGQICFYSGVNENLYNTAYAWMGRIRGGLAMSTIMACAGFAAIWRAEKLRQLCSLSGYGSLSPRGDYPQRGHHAFCRCEI